MYIINIRALPGVKSFVKGGKLWVTARKKPAKCSQHFAGLLLKSL